jgi:hypothetical protein
LSPNVPPGTTLTTLCVEDSQLPVRERQQGTPQFGLIVEEVAKVNPDLVVRDPNEEIYSVHYEAVNATLLNEFLKAHRHIEEQDKRIEQLTAQLKEQALQIQKVNDKVELSRSVPETVANNQR